MKSSSTYGAIKKADINELRKNFFLTGINYIKRVEQKNPYTKFEDELTFIHKVLMKENSYT